MALFAHLGSEAGLAAAIYPFSGPCGCGLVGVPLPTQSPAACPHLGRLLLTPRWPGLWVLQSIQVVRSVCFGAITGFCESFKMSVGYRDGGAS